MPTERLQVRYLGPNDFPEQPPFYIPATPALDQLIARIRELHPASNPYEIAARALVNAGAPSLLKSLDILHITEEGRLVKRPRPGQARQLQGR